MSYLFNFWLRQGKTKDEMISIASNLERWDLIEEINNYYKTFRGEEDIERIHKNINTIETKKKEKQEYNSWKQSREKDSTIEVRVASSLKEKLKQCNRGIISRVTREALEKYVAEREKRRVEINGE